MWVKCYYFCGYEGGDGMGTKDLMIKLRLSQEQLEILDRYCTAINESRSSAIRILINYAYENALFLKAEAIKNHMMIEENRIEENMISYYDSQVIEKYKDYCRYKKARRELLDKFNEESIEVLGEDFLVNSLKTYDRRNKALLGYCDAELQLFYDVIMALDYDKLYYPSDDEE